MSNNYNAGQAMSTGGGTGRGPALSVGKSSS